MRSTESRSIDDMFFMKVDDYDENLVLNCRRCYKSCIAK